MISTRSQLGFTLIELLVVFTIVVVLSLIAIPSMISYVQLNRLTGTAESLYYSLEYARSEAVKRNTTVYVSFVTGSNWCYGINPGSACTCTTPSSCSLGAVTAPSSTQTTLSTTGVVSNKISFEPTHGATYAAKSTLTFTVYGQTTAMGVDVSAMGDVVVCSTNVSGYSGC